MYHLTPRRMPSLYPERLIDALELAMSYWYRPKGTAVQQTSMSCTRSARVNCPLSTIPTPCMTCLHKQCVGENESSSGDMLNSRERSHQHLHISYFVQGAPCASTQTLVWVSDGAERITCVFHMLYFCF